MWFSTNPVCGSSTRGRKFVGELKQFQSVEVLRCLECTKMISDGERLWSPAVETGPGNKVDGKVQMLPGKDGGGYCPTGSGLNPAVTARHLVKLRYPRVARKFICT